MTDKKHLNSFQRLIGIRFHNPDLLLNALTHRSFVNESEIEVPDNERLEFLGDSVLDFVVADMLFRRFPDSPEGELTQLRSALVRTESLAAMALDCQVGAYLRIGRGEEQSGGRSRINNLCRGLEAIIGAIYLDQGLDAAKVFLYPRLETMLTHILENSLHRDARSELQERSQAEQHVTPVYRLVDAAGPEHEREFYVEVVVGEHVIAMGAGSSKRSAAQAAARAALRRLEAEGWPASYGDAKNNVSTLTDGTS